MSAIEPRREGSGSGGGDQISQAGLACERCKRRKIKCDRVLPACRTCAKTGRDCSYPLVSQKPGPKPGAPQRRRNRQSQSHEPTEHERTPLGTASNDADSNLHLQTWDSLPLGEHDLQNNPMSSGLESQRHNGSFTGNQNHHQPTPNSHLPTPPGNTSSAQARPESRGLSLAHMLHPSHQDDPLQQLSAAAHEMENRDARLIEMMRSALCKDLSISLEIYRYLQSSYFANMTSFSLFHRPTFEEKLCGIQSSIQRKALIASMFAFSARFTDLECPKELSPGHIPSPDVFAAIANRAMEEALKECSENTPPLCVLQAMILTTFHDLANGVRSRSWRAVGTCASIAYDLHLHTVDKDRSNPSSEIKKAIIDEERRRAWWAIWEFDVFASTIRRLPTAIDWSINETWLPVDDEIWFANGSAHSCTLNPDPAVAWKDLERSGNKSSKAWFIVVNALMRCGNVLAYPQSYSRNRSMFERRGAETLQASLDILANSLYCLSAAQPSSIAYQGQFLPFSSSGSKRSIQADSDKHSLHLMMQLSRFMIYHQSVFNSTSSHLGVATSLISAQGTSTPTDKASIDQGAWRLYLAAASEIISLIRNCSPRHVPYVNPFLSSTIWLAAAAQIVARSLNLPLIDRRVAESNLDLLQINLNAYVSFWGVSTTLQQKLGTLEAKLQGLRNQPQPESDASTAQPQTQQVDQQRDTQRIPSSNMHGNLDYMSVITSGNSTQYSVPLGGYNSAIGVAVGTHPLTRGAWNLGDWGAGTPVELTVPQSDFAPDMSADLWGWGIDELLTYGGNE